MGDPNRAGLADEPRIGATVGGDPRLRPADRASILEFIDGDDFADLLDSTGDTIHGNDLLP